MHRRHHETLFSEKRQPLPVRPEDYEKIKLASTVCFSGFSTFTILTGPAVISLGHVVLPAIGLRSLVVGGGSLSTAAISFMVGGGISLLPALALYALINKTVKNPGIAIPLQLLVFGGYIASSYLVGAALFDVSSNSLFLQALGGGFTIPIMLLGAVIAVVAAIGVASLLCQGGSKVCKSVSKCSPGMFARKSTLNHDFLHSEDEDFNASLVGSHQ